MYALDLVHRPASGSGDFPLHLLYLQDSLPKYSQAVIKFFYKTYTIVLSHKLFRSVWALNFLNFIVKMKMHDF